jgi:hypothetical protein
VEPVGIEPAQLLALALGVVGAASPSASSPAPPSAPSHRAPPAPHPRGASSGRIAEGPAVVVGPVGIEPAQPLALGAILIEPRQLHAHRDERRGLAERIEHIEPGPALGAHRSARIARGPGGGGAAVAIEPACSSPTGMSGPASPSASSASSSRPRPRGHPYRTPPAPHLAEGLAVEVRPASGPRERHRDSERRDRRARGSTAGGHRAGAHRARPARRGPGGGGGADGIEPRAWRLPDVNYIHPSTTITPPHFVRLIGPLPTPNGAPLFIRD